MPSRPPLPGARRVGWTSPTGLPSCARSEQERDGARVRELGEVRGAAAEEVLGAVVLVALARAAVVLDVEVIRVAEGDLPEDPASSGRLVPEAHPLRVAIEAAGRDGRRVARIPPAVLVLGDPIEV